MDIATLLHSLTVAGLQLRLGDAFNTLQVVGEVSKLTLEQQRALRDHKLNLLEMLTPPPTCFIHGDIDADAEARERESIQLADISEAAINKYFQGLTLDMRFYNPQALAQVLLESEGKSEPCRFCGGNQTYLATIHNGESLRRDCANCGRFVEFAVWQDSAQVEKIFNRIAEKNGYNDKGEPPECSNTQAALTSPLYQAKEKRCG